MSRTIGPLRCAGKPTPKADRGGVGGMGMARPRCGTESPRHRPLTSSPQTETDGSERVRQRLRPYPHRTRAKETRSRVRLVNGGCNAVPLGSRSEAKQRT